MEILLCFWALLTVKYGRFFNLVLFGHRDEKKIETSFPYFGVKLSCVCLLFAYRKKVMTYS